MKRNTPQCATTWLLSVAYLAFAFSLPLAQAQEPLRLGPGRTNKKETAKSAPPAATNAPSAKTATVPPQKSSFEPLELPATYKGSQADAWNSLFSEHLSKPKDEAFRGGVRAQVRKLVANQDFDLVNDLISAAIRNDSAEPWMYEALALALEAQGASEKEQERAILSAVDLSRDLDTALTTAGYLVNLKLDRAAIRLFQDIASQDPTRSEPYLQALVCAERLNDAAAIRWCCIGVLHQAWPSDQREIEVHAKRIAEATILLLEKEGKTEDSQQFKKELAAALARDVRVSVKWTGDCDIDLSVLEPTGEVCSYRNPRTIGGGQILGDTFARSSAAAPREGFSETFICPEGFAGKYQVFLKRVWGEVAGGKVNVEVITHYGSPNETVEVQQIALGKDGAIVNFALDQGRRKEPLTETRANTAATQQIEVARHVLAQQIGGGSSASKESYYANNAPLFVDPFGRLAIPLVRGAVGFRPQISTLQDGPMLIAGPAVVSADRRFVRMRLSPIFRTIGEVQTFNFATGAVGNGNGTGNTPNNGGAGGGTPGAGGGIGGGAGGGVGT